MPINVDRGVAKPSTYSAQRPNARRVDENVTRIGHTCRKNLSGIHLSGRAQRYPTIADALLVQNQNTITVVRILGGDPPRKRKHKITNELILTLGTDGNIKQSKTQSARLLANPPIRLDLFIERPEDFGDCALLGKRWQGDRQAPDIGSTYTQSRGASSERGDCPETLRGIQVIRQKSGVQFRYVRPYDGYINCRYGAPWKLLHVPTTSGGFWHARNQYVSHLDLSASEPMKGLLGDPSILPSLDKVAEPNIGNLQQAEVLTTLVFQLNPVAVGYQSACKPQGLGRPLGWRGERQGDCGAITTI
jgi:hypothetical protein